MRVESDNWLTTLLGCSAYRLVSEGAGPDAGFTVSAPGFYHAKVPTRDVRTLQQLQALGFYVVDTNVTFEREPGPLGGGGDVTVRNATPEDAAEVLDIAATCFVYTRFHLDPQVSDEVANAIKREWIANYVRGVRGDGLLVAERNGRPAGFLALLAAPTQTPSLRVIDLIGVAREHQGYGVGKALVRHFVEEAVGRCALLRVGTQVANIPSMRLYEQSGFRMAGSSYVLHAHVQRELGAE